MNKNYFGEQGLTTTSASYLANLAQEQIKTNESWLSNLSLINESKTLLSQGKKVVTRKTNVKDLSTINEVLDTNAKFYTFIAYIKEAIKEKERAVRSLPDFEVWAFDKLEAAPEHPNDIDESDIIAEFDASKMYRYLKLQQYAATYGKAIHRDCDITTARAVAQRVANDPSSISELASDVVITEREPAFSLESIDEMFNNLQSTRRDCDKQLNSIKFEIKSEANKRTNEAVQKYKAEYDAWRNKRESLRAEYQTWVRTQREEIETQWKIVVPDELIGILKYLQSLGKVDK